MILHVYACARIMTVDSLSQIVEAKSLLSRMSELLSLLSSAHKQLCALSSDDVTQWREITSQVNAYKVNNS